MFADKKKSIYKTMEGASTFCYSQILRFKKKCDVASRLLYIVKKNINFLQT